MPGSITLQPPDEAGIASLVIANPGKRNAIDTAMWRELRAVFDRLATEPQPPRVIVVHGAGGDFAAGGDIEEFPAFRFQPDTLEAFHEDLVAPALHAMLDCELPLVARIEGACVGGGLEIAACCDVRVAAAGSRFGIPVAKLGFPLAPGEAEIVLRVLPAALLRELLLEARLLDAREAHARGIISAVASHEAVAAEAYAVAARMAQLSSQALRLDKRLLRQLERAPRLSAEERRACYAYADSPEHREGLAAFLEKRAPRFDNDPS